MAQRAPPRQPRKGCSRKESMADLLKDLELLGVDTEDYEETKTHLAGARDSRIETLKKTNGTLQKGYDKIVNDLEQTRERRHVLKKYYSKIKKVLSDTQGISLQEEAGDFLNRAEKYNKDLKNKKFIVLVAGETSAGKSSLINLLLNQQVLPTGVLQNTLTICEISYGAKQEAVIHFKKSSFKLEDTKFDALKQYIENPTNDEDECEKIEIKIPNPLLKGGVVIVDSPGIGDSEQVCNIALEYLPQAFAFIYVINSPNAGGMQDDRLMRIVKKWKELYGEDQCNGLTSESALFVCNKWDDVQRQTESKSDVEKIQNEIICKLKKEIPNLNQKSQVIEMSVSTAAKIQRKFGVMSDDLSSLVNGLQRLLPLCLEKKTEHFYRMTSGCLKSLSDQVKAEVNNAKRNREERLKAQQDVEVKLEKLRQESFIKETEEALSKHLNNISQKVVSYLLQDDVRSAFCTWEKKDLPQIDDDKRPNVEKLKKIYKQCLEQRLKKFVQTLEERDQLFVKAHADLEQRFRQGFFEFENDVREIDQVLVGESTDEVLLQFDKLRPPLDARVKKFIFLTSVVFMPVLFPIGLAAGVLSAPVIGYLAVDRILNERQLKNDPCQGLKELSTLFLQRNIDQVIFDRVSQEFTVESGHISSIKRCYQELLEKYEKKCQDLTKGEDEDTRKGTVEKLSPLYDKLEEISQNLTFDAIQHGIHVMSPGCEIDKSTLSEKEKLGEGSFGEVYKGEISLSGRKGAKEVAVKKLKGTPGASNVASFLKEAEILMQLNHIHIVALYGVVMDVQNYQLRSLALVFELCNASLKNHIFQNRRKIPWETKSAAVITCQWGIDILDALDFIHGKNIVHRDLKLANVLITKHEQIRVADLGLATFKTLITGTYCGTQRYMAPEIRLEQKIYDSKVDMYSFGLMMWEMWFGERVPPESISWSQDDVNRQIEVKKQGRQGRRHPPPAEWIELMVSLWDSEPCVRKTAMESQVLIKEIKRLVKEAE